MFARLKNRTTILICCIGLLFVPRVLFGDDSQWLSSNSSQGLEFWLAVPGNDDPQQPINALEFYVTSLYDTEVTIEAPGFGYSRTVALRAMSVVTFSTKDQTANWQWEFWKSEEKLRYGVHITAKKPISVYMLNGKTVTSDGYMAIPCTKWGTEYIHNSYYDFNEVRSWKSGFCIIAGEKQTKVTLKLNGKGTSLAKTVKGRKIGETWSVVLDAGDVYPVMGDGTTAGGFDLSGSIVTSDKPVGFISFHQRVIIPFNAQNGRDHIIEMLPPTSSWGKEFYTIELKRDNKGDFFRVVASQDNTIVDMVYMDKKDSTVLGRRTINLSKKGDFWEDYNYWTGTGQTEGIRGMAVWKSDKPILLCQYAYSSNWDSGLGFDPFMVVQTPVEQYGSNAIFQTPNNKAFNQNLIGFIVQGDDPKVDPNQTKLKSMVFDGDTIYKKYPQILKNRIKGTNYYWGQLDFATPGFHMIESKTKIGAYIYGFSEFDSYGWPAAMMQRVVDDKDTVSPMIAIQKTTDSEGDSSRFVIGFEDKGYSVGISGYDISQNSTNIRLIPVTTQEFGRLPVIKETSATVEIINKSESAFTIVSVTDHAGNFSKDTIRFSPITKVSFLNLLQPEHQSKNVELNAEFQWDRKAQDSTFLNIRTGNQEWQTFGPVSGTSYKNTMLSLKGNTIYEWRLVRKGMAVSDTFSFTTLTPAILIYPVDNAKGVDTRTQFIWSKMNEVSEYLLDVAEVQKGWGSLTIHQLVKDTTFSVTDKGILKPYTSYMWRVADAAGNKVIDTAYFTTASSTYPATLIYPINNVENVDTTTYFRWSRISGVAEYILHVAEVEKGWNALALYKAITDTMYTVKKDNPLKPSTKYMWRVTDLTGELIIDTAYFMTIGATTSVEEKADEDSEQLMRVFPNPATESFIVQVRKEGSDYYALQVINSIGEVCYEVYENKETVEINCRNYSPGIYWVKMIIHDHSVQLPFVIHR